MPVSLWPFPDMAAAALAQVPRPVLTGASGFVGSRVAARLDSPATLPLGRGGWREATEAFDFRGATVIHLAARVHDPRGRDADFERDNVEKTSVLAHAAAAGGAARLVFASTVKVFGEESGAAPFTEKDEPRPEDAYARSKWRAEDVLDQVSTRTGLPVVVLRIPLAYGPGVGGNFAALARLSDSGWWLPFGAIGNRRSLIHVDDLAEAIVTAAAHEEAPGRTFIVAHPEPVSTTRLVEAMRAALGRPRRLFACPPALLEAAATLAGRGAQARRLTRSLEVDPAAFTRTTGWTARIGVEEGVAAALRGARA
jgi:UDP-glucose 4-epimerase